MPHKVISNYQFHPNGRIWVLWNPMTVCVLAVVVHGQFIHCLVFHNGTCVSFQVTFIYTSNDPIVRRDLWSSLHQICGTVQEWLVLGDFNITRGNEERISASPPCLSDMLDFNSCLLRCGLDDLHCFGCEFTWSNKQEELSRVWCKLDRALGSDPWIRKFPSSSADFFPVGISDHSPAMVTIFEERVPQTSFSFLNCWVSDPAYYSTVQTAWRYSVPGSKLFRFFAKLRSVRRALKAFHRSNFSSVKRRVDDAKTTLERCQQQLQSKPDSVPLMKHEQSLLQHYIKLGNVELSILRQRAKVDGIIKNDSNTTFFYSRIRERQHTQFIGAISDHYGNTRTGLEEVASAFVDYYTTLLGTSVPVSALDTAIIFAGVCVDSEDWSGLCKPVTVIEISQALKGIGQNRSPRTDGFSSGFFIHTWDIIGTDLCDCVKDFFRTGRLVKQENTTLIALISKKKVATSVLDFRPTSCCTVVYKIFCRILTSRLQNVMGKLVGEEQTAFVQGRSIFENILLSQSLVKGYSWKFLTPRCFNQSGY
ncbi:hypothetical protein RND81_12G040500 [Saponaria officinalis]|uniref:Reverse transcriptase domain-containing protein n=1 Tax=Saponaria officinalis TaxID=3572 RepID=A0AAW1H749_SAPOF